MTDTLIKPYANLTPSLILTAIETTGYLCSGGLLALNSYENRVYQVGIEDAKPLIVKFYRPHRWSDEAILEEHQFALELIDHEIPVIAPIIANNQTLHHYEGFRFALFERKGGHALEFDNVEQLRWMGRFIGRVHAVGASRPFEHRPQLDAQSHGYIPYQYLLENDFIPAFLLPQYCQIADRVLELVDKTFQQAGTIDYIRMHGDCQPCNVLWNDTGPHIVDLDDCEMGPAIQDMWMLLSGSVREDHVSAELECILAGYREFFDFNPREISLIEALRTLRMMQYSAWLANRWLDPAFPLAFPWFNTPHYWQEHLKDLEEQIPLLETLI